jgi:hypothetical protein
MPKVMPTIIQVANPPIASQNVTGAAFVIIVRTSWLRRNEYPRHGASHSIGLGESLEKVRPKKIPLVLLDGRDVQLQVVTIGLDDGGAAGLATGQSSRVRRHHAEQEEDGQREEEEEQHHAEHAPHDISGHSASPRLAEGTLRGSGGAAPPETVRSERLGYGVTYISAYGHEP